MNTQLQQLLQQNPGLDLATPSTPAALAGLNWEGLDRAATLAALGAYQRLWQLCPDAEVVDLLQSAGFGSAHQIAALSLPAFQARVEAGLRALRPGLRLSTDIHARAGRTRDAVNQYAVHALPSSFVATARLDTRTSGLPDFHGDEASYRALFGPISGGPCNDCDSIFSPAAYFVDLMQLIDTYITQASGSALPAALSLQVRRPDLWQLLLNCENTAQELPYLQLANQIMASTLRQYLAGADVWEYAATHVFPLQLPVNKPLDEIRAYLQHSGSSLTQVYAAVGRPKADIARESLGLTVEGLQQLQSGHSSDIAGAYGLSSTAALSQVGTFLDQTGLTLDALQDLLYQGMDKPLAAVYLYGNSSYLDFGLPATLNHLKALTVEAWVNTALMKGSSGTILGTAAGTAADGFSIHLANAHLAFILASGGTSATYIVNVPDDGWYHIAATWSASSSTMQVYVNGQPGSAEPTVSGYTGNQFVKNDLGTPTYALQAGRLATGGSTFLGDMAELRIWNVMRSQAEVQNNMRRYLSGHEAGLIGCWHLNEGEGQNIYDRSPNGITGQLRNTSGNIGHRVATNTLYIAGHEQVPALLAPLYINAGQTSLYAAIEQGAGALSLKLYDGLTTYTTLADSIYAALNAVIRLANALGWSFADVDWALRSIGAGQPGHFTDAQLQDLAGLHQLMQRFGQSVDALTACWHDLKTFGKGSGESRASFWNQTFNHPDVFYAAPGLAHPQPYQPQYSGNPFFGDAILLLDTTDTSETASQLRASLAQSLQTSEPDLSLILDYIQRNATALTAASRWEAATGTSVTATTIGLSVCNMSLLFRLAKLPQWLKIPVDQFLALLPLMGLVGVGKVGEVLDLSAKIAWLQANQISVWAYAWLLGRQLPDSPAFTLSPQQRIDLEKSLLTSSGAVMLHSQPFEEKGISRIMALEIHRALVHGDVLDARGLVLSERALDAANVQQALAQSPTLCTAFELYDPFRQVLDMTSARDNATNCGIPAITLPMDIAHNADVIAHNSFTIMGRFRVTAWPSGGIWASLYGSPTDIDPNTGQGSNGYKGPQITLVGNNPGNIQCAYSTAGHGWKAKTINTDDPLELNRWYHIAWVNDNGLWSLYFDGFLIGEPYQSGATSIYANETNTAYFGDQLTGQTAELSLWSIALSAEQIAALLNDSPASNAPGLIGYWPVNEGSGAVVNDLGPKHYTGVLSSHTAWVKHTPPAGGIPVVNEVLEVVVTAKASQEALALQKLAGAFRMGTQQMRALHTLMSASLRSQFRVNTIGTVCQLPYYPVLATSTFSLTFWFRVDQLPAGTDSWGLYDCSYLDDTGIAYGFLVELEPTGSVSIQYALNSGSTKFGVASIGGLVLGDWNFVSVTLGGAQIAFQMNGSTATLTSGQTDLSHYQPTYAPQPTTVGGAYVSPTAGTVDLAISDVRIFDQVLSASALATERDSLRPHSSALLAWWPMEAGSGTTIYDWGPNGFHGVLTYTGDPLAVWHNLHLNHLLSADLKTEELESLLAGLATNALAAQKFTLGADELIALRKAPAAFGGPDAILRGATYTIPVLDNLADLRWLKAAFPKSGDQWLRVLAEANDDPAAAEASDDLAAAKATVAQLTGWPTAQVQLVLEGLAGSSLTTPAGLRQLCTPLLLATRLGVQPSLLIALGQLSHLPASGSTVPGSHLDNWAYYNSMAAAVKSVVQGRYSQDALQAALSKVEAELMEKERDVLAALLLHFLQGIVNDVTSLQDLYEYLLVDTKTAGNVKISPLEQALDGLQLYVNRCMNGLEMDVNCTIPKAWWSWMRSYRVWQANREVYLYPENYADPSLRKAQTPLYKAFVNQLNQGQLNAAGIDKALGAYLDGFTEVANLRIVDAYARPLAGAADADGIELYVLGRSRHSPPAFYTRRGFLAEGQPSAWTAWEELSFSVGADTASIIHAFGRTYVFWVQQTEKNISDSGTSTTNTTTTTLQCTEAAIHYSYQQLNGNWLAPQTLVANLPMRVADSQGVLIPAVLNLSGWNPADSYLGTLAWQKPRLHLLPADGQQAARLLVQLGDMVAKDGTKSIPVHGLTPSSALGKAWKGLLSDLRTRVNGLAGNSATTVLPAFLLDEVGNRGERALIANLEKSATLSAFIGAEGAGLAGQLYARTASAFGVLRAVGWMDPSPQSAVFPLDYMESNGNVPSNNASFVATNSAGNGGVKVGTISVHNWMARNGTRNVMNFPGQYACSLNVASPAFAYTSNVTVAAWVCPQVDVGTKNAFSKKTNSPSYQIIAGYSDNNLQGGYALYLYQSYSDQPFLIGVNIGASSSDCRVYHCTPAHPLQKGTWYHIAFTFAENTGGATPKLYLNGVLQTYSSSGGTHYTGLGGYGDHFSIGEVPTFQGYFGGYLANLVVAGRAFTAEEIRESMYLDEYIPLLGQVQPGISTTFNITNAATGAFLDTGKESFLFFPSTLDGFHFVDPVLTCSDHDGTLSLGISSALISESYPEFQFERMGTCTAKDLEDAFREGGAARLLELRNQFLSEPDFSTYHPESTHVLAPASTRLDFEGPMREYLWELFFHIPLYVGNLYQAQQQYENARRWYEYIFVPSRMAADLGLVGYWPLSGSPKAQIGRSGSFQYSASPWVETTFADGSTRQVMDCSVNNLLLDPSILPQGDTISITFWTNGQFGSGALPSNAILTSRDGSNRLAEIYLPINYGTDGEIFWEAGNVNGSWDSVSKNSVRSDYNGAWIFWAFTKNAVTGNMVVYRNAEVWLQGSGKNMPIQNLPTTFLVGNGYKTLLTELSLWSVELSAEEVAAAYNRPGNLFWNFRPFQQRAPQTLAQSLTQAPAQLAVSRYDPFDPDALAAIRWGAWEKNVFQQYIRNLIAWGDQNFAGDTWEDVSEATQLYVVADSLLGVPPLPPAKLLHRPALSYSAIAANYSSGDIPEFLIDLETKVSVGNHVTTGMASVLNGYFCVPENTQLTQLWAVVANRLYKIRHGLNLQGQPSQPALFGPPLNPADMVAGGSHSASGPASANANLVPAYRFSEALQLAKSITSSVMEFGNGLLAALEKQDGETLQQLRSTQESAILTMTLQAKADQVNQLLQEQQGLQYSLESAQNEVSTLQGWISQFLLPEETLALAGSSEAFLFTGLVTDIKLTSSLAYLLPDIFGLADGGMQFGESIKAVAEGLGGISQLLNEGAGILRESAGYVRRQNDWTLRLQTTNSTVSQLQAQIAAHQYALSAAQQEYNITQTQYQQSQDVLSFLQTKFTNEDLYTWMAGQMSTLYYQAYQLAVDVALQAQTCYQYELSRDDTFVTGNPWNNQYKGLLAGDALMLSLHQMEKAYHDNNTRSQEIRKTFSLMQKDPKALIQLRKTGSCSFDFTELDFDLDFPGHYNRKIATLSVTIPAVVGPYQNLNATLIQTRNRVLTKPDIEGVKSLLGLAASPRNGVVRTDWNPDQQVSISTGINDAGLFQVSLNDPRYLPFEGTGAVSSWQLYMPKAANAFDFAAISDVLIQIEYTSSVGGSTFASEVARLDPLKHYNGTLYLSLRQQYASAWHAFLRSDRLNFSLMQQMFPINLVPGSLQLGHDGYAYLVPSLAQGVDTDGWELSLNDNPWEAATGAALIGDADNFAASNQVAWYVSVTKDSGSDPASPQKIDPADLQDILLVLPFTGELDWQL